MNEADIKPVILCILDGWGIEENSRDNAIYLADTPNYDYILNNYPHSKLETSAQFVGLPQGQMGNSEVGHMNIGAGRIIIQDLPKIDKAFANNLIESAPILKNLIEDLKFSGGNCHLAGLLSDGGVHSHIEHIIKLAVILAKNNINVYIHAFTDGRDTPPKSAMKYLQNLAKNIKDYPNVKLATISGRFYAMDRDNRFERVEAAYNAIIASEGEKFANFTDAVNHNYAGGVTDEFITPCIIGDYKGAEDKDALLIANYRADRVRQITAALCDENFNKFERKKIVKFLKKISMTEYSKSHKAYLEALFAPQEIENSLGEVIAKNNKKQLRIAETEKYAHVTFFFNAGKEELFEKEERILVPSPKVKTYDMQPEMSAFEVTDKILEQLNRHIFDLIVVNFANTDMVGHTGNIEATKKAVEAVDKCLGRLLEFVEKNNLHMIISADHGNAEKMTDNTEPFTSHTMGPVPFILISRKYKNNKLKDGKLADIAPTILAIMQIDKPADMTGVNLINE